MATVKYGGGITQMSGSIAGTVFARNRFGNYCRPRTKPVNPNSTRQAAQRGYMANLVAAWANLLNSTQRIAWATYASAIAMKNRLGEVVYITGFNHYVRSNTLRLQHAVARVDNGPTDLSLPAKDPTFSIACNAGNQHISFTFDNTLPWASQVGGFLSLFQGQPQKVTRNFFGGPWQFAGALDGEAVPPVSPKFKIAPMTLTVGQKVWCYARICEVNGRVSEPMVVSCIVE